MLGLDRPRLVPAALLVVVFLVPTILDATDVADAKGKRKGSSKVRVRSGPVALSRPSGGIYGLTTIPFRVGKKAKGKVVSPNTVTLTFTASSPAPGPLAGVELELSNPAGMTIPLGQIGDPQTTTLGPVTFTPNSPHGICLGALVCPAPNDDVRGPAYQGTVGVPALGLFAGTKARGLWRLYIMTTAMPAPNDPTTPPAVGCPCVFDSDLIRISLFESILDRR